MMAKKAAVIGAGFGGLSTAALLAKEGLEVTLLEKNEGPGGRARVWKKDGFVFDMGPSWYLMPEVFEDFFELFGKRREDYYGLVRIDPYYRVFSEKKKRRTSRRTSKPPNAFSGPSRRAPVRALGNTSLQPGINTIPR
jgi:phytoene desaturase